MDEVTNNQTEANEIETNEVSLSWLILSTRDYRKEQDWFWDKKHTCCYGMLKEGQTGNIARDLCNYNKRTGYPEEFFSECVLMPELQDLDKEEAKLFLINWCNEKGIPYLDDLEIYDKVKDFYYGWYDFETREEAMKYKYFIHFAYNQ